MSTFSEVTDALFIGLPALVNGVVAQITRQAYINPYINEINFQQYVPIVFLNVIENVLTISNTATLNFSTTDLFLANDWIVLNGINL